MATAKPAQKNDTATDAPKVDPVDQLPGSTVSAVVSAVLSEAVEGHRWGQRMSRADVVKEALTEWAEKRDLLPDARKRLFEKVSAPAAE